MPTGVFTVYFQSQVVQPGIAQADRTLFQILVDNNLSISAPVTEDVITSTASAPGPNVLVELIRYSL